MGGGGILTVLATLLLCVSSACVAEGGPDVPLGRKFHPGHYVALAASNDAEPAIRRALRPGVAGVEIRYSWRELEPVRDVYDFSAIAADLVVTQESGAQLVVFITDKSFTDERMTPEYLWAEFTLPIRSPDPGKGYVAKRWDPYVVVRFNKLLAELGGHFDTNPHFEGVAIQESALGIDASILDREGYSAPAYRDALIAMLANARRVMPRSQVFWYMNYLPRQQQLLQSVCAAGARDGIVLGGPDVLPESAPLRKHVYPLLKGQRSSAVLFTSAQYDSYRHRHSGSKAATKYWTPQEIFEYSRDQLGVRYLFWTDMQHRRPADSYTIEDAYPVIAAHPQFNGKPRRETPSAANR